MHSLIHSLVHNIAQTRRLRDFYLQKNNSKILQYKTVEFGQVFILIHAKFGKTRLFNFWGFLDNFKCLQCDSGMSSHSLLSITLSLFVNKV